MTDGNLDALNRHLAEREEYDRHQELLDAEKERDELAERVEELEAKIAEYEEALDSAEVKFGLSTDGNMWRFWANKACTLAQIKGDE